MTKRYTAFVKGDRSVTSLSSRKLGVVDEVKTYICWIRSNHFAKNLYTSEIDMHFGSLFV